MSRLWRYGTCYSRVRDYVRNKYIPDEARPIWFDVWSVHPPFRSPVLIERQDFDKDVWIRPRNVKPVQGGFLPGFLQKKNLNLKNCTIKYGIIFK